MSDDELTVVQEELMAAQAEVERFELAAADREARAAHLEGQLSELRQELGPVDQNPRAVRVGETSDAVDVREIAGHIGGPADCDERDATDVFFELPVEILLVQPPFRCDCYVNYIGSCAPWQIVRVVLHHGGDHH